MTPEQQKQFNEELVALEKRYNVVIIPTLGLQLKDVTPETPKDAPVVEEAKIVEKPAA